MKIAMWSGPRNLSTAMMYAFGNRSDTAAWDEPFYAPYLAATGLDHPMREAILERHETVPEAIAARIDGPVPDGLEHWYMKHMTMHMLPDFPLDWASDCINVHLIRHPARVVASYMAKRENPIFDDLGFRQQTEIFARFPGPIVDSADIRANPEIMLRALCAKIGLPFDPAMLVWTPGPRAEDGAWAPHWYGSIHRSSGFEGAESPLPDIGPEGAPLVEEAMPHYAALHEMRLRPEPS